ncbi:MAG: FTR1 family protein [Chitinophagales bacterium]
MVHRPWLDPAPVNFQESTHLFPFHVFNTIQLGIEGTAMVPLSQLSEKETWDIAFYVMTLGFADANTSSDLYDEAADLVDLNMLSNSSNEELAKLFPKESEAYVKALRFYIPSNSQEESLALSLKMLEEAMSFYEQGLYAESNQRALDAYFIGFEPVEINLGATNPSMVLTIEKEMMLFRSYLKVPGNEVLIQEQYDKIAYHFEAIKNEDQQGGFWFVFLASVSILLREGLEALLIIVAILAALNSFANGEKAKKYVHAGWLSAAFLGIVSYFFAAKLIAMGSHKRELIEGFGALLAVVILLSVGFWLHDKSNAASWTKYVKSKLSKHVDSNSLWSVAVLAFIVVFREAFESVVFLSSLSMNASADANLGVLLGSLFSAALIILIGLLIIKFSKRLPIHQVFKISSITMIVLAVILAGRGVKELQEAALLDVNLLGFKFSADVLGFYPTIQTIMAQIFTLAIALGLWYYNKKQAKTLA